MAEHLERGVLTFFLLLAAWVFFTASIAVGELVIGGAISLVLTVFFSKRFLGGKPRKKLHPLRWLYFITFIFYVVGREIIAHAKVIAIILSPRLKIKPELVRFESKLRGDGVLTALANSITLTPGTVSVDLDKREFVVHSITKTTVDEVLGKSEPILMGVEK